jgi:hypothetical protein
MDAGGGVAQLAWTDNSSNETGFEIQRTPAFSSGQNMTVAANQISFRDSCGNGTYSYSVRSINAAGNSAYAGPYTVSITSGGGTPPPSPSGFVVLTPGGGFTGATTQPPAVGAVGSAGYDAKAIARWDVVPYQTFTGDFNVGVVAFHINGIDRVEFSANGGPWTAATSMQLNPQTNVWEYTATMHATDFQDGPVELRAIVYPRGSGLPRLLSGPVDGGTAYLNGNHSMFLSANSHGTLPGRTVYVSSTIGSDTAGDGSAATPYMTPAYALGKITQQYGSSDGATVYLMAGNYSWGPPSSTYPATQTRWATLTAAPGVPASSVVFNTYGSCGFRTRLIHASNLTVQGAVSFRTADESYLWVDGCRLIGPGIHIDSGFFEVGSGTWSGVYCTDCEASDNRNGIRGATFTRNCYVHDISGSPFGDTRMAVSNVADRYQEVVEDFHGDVFHWQPPDNTWENLIVYNLQAKNFNTQGLFGEVGTGSRIDNAAMVNIHVSRETTSGDCGGWWELGTNHLLMWYVQYPDEQFSWAQPNFGTTLTNVSVQGNVVYAFSVAGLPTGSRVDENHYINPSLYGALLLGTNLTTGDPLYVDPTNQDYRLQATSPLLNRVSRDLLGVPADVRGRRRAATTAAGPYAGENE